MSTDSSNGLATIPESSPYPVMDFDIDHSAMQIPPSPMRQISQHIIPFNPQEPWDLGSHQHDPTYPPSFSTNPSYPSYKPSIFTEGSSKAPTEDSSIYSTGDFPPQVSGMEDVTRSYVIPGLPESSHDTANGPPGDTLPGTCSSADSPELTSRSRTTPASIKYSCTLCDSKATFRGKSEWKRHELSHMPSVEYVCLPEGHMDRDHRCAICGANNPDIQHVIEHNAHLCVAKDESARTWVRKDKFVKHLASHGLSSSCPQVAKWSRKLPPRISGCGFCIRGFNDSNERSLHVAKHFESGSQRTDWDHSKVILGQLGQPRTALSWQSILGATFGGQPSPPISWSESLASGIQKRLEEGRENGHDLALAAFELSSLCQTAKRDESDCDQPVLDPNEDTVHRVEHLLRDLDPSSQSWFDDSEPASELIGGWGFS